MRKNNNFAKFGSWLRKSTPTIASLTMVGVTLIASYIITGPTELGWVNDIEFSKPPLEQDLALYQLIFMGVIIAPLLETFLFQMVPFAILHHFKTFRTHRWAMVLIPALIFGSMHYYSVVYMLATTIAGALLMYLYIVKWRRHPYWNVVLFHALWNAVGITVDSLSKAGYIG